MALPKISHPLFDVTVPSTKKKIKIRPMLVKEEKILLMAKTGEDATDILSAVKQVVNNCIIDSGIDVDKLAIFDIEYLFLKIRTFSVDSVSKVSYRDNEDDTIYDFEIDLNKVEVKFPEKLDKNIMIGKVNAIIMKYPEAALYSDKEFVSTPADQILDKLVLKCIDKIVDGEETYDAKTFSEEELEEFVNNLDVNTYAKTKDFLNTIPTLYYKIEYKNKNDKDRIIELTSLTDFFTLR